MAYGPLHTRLLNGLREVLQPLGLNEAQLAAIDIFHGCIENNFEVYVAGFRCRYYNTSPRRWVCFPYDKETQSYRINAFITIYFGPGD